MILHQDKLALIQQLDSTIIENNNREISGEDVNSFFHAFLDKISSDPSLLIPRLELSFNNGAYDLLDILSTANAKETAIRVRPESSLAFLAPYNPSIWLFRRGRSLADKGFIGANSTVGKKTKWLHPTDRDVTNRAGWSKYGNGNRGEGSDKNPLTGTYKGLLFNLKTEWAIPSDAYETKTPVSIRLESERYFGVWNTDVPDSYKHMIDFIGLDLAPSNLSSNKLQVRTRLRGASMKASKNKLVNRLNNDTGEYDIIASPIRGFGTSWEFKMAIVIDHPILERTKIIGPKTDSFLFKVTQANGKTSFTACLK